MNKLDALILTFYHLDRFGLLTKEEENRLVDKFIIEVCKTENINENVRVGEIKHIIDKKLKDT